LRQTDEYLKGMWNTFKKYRYALIVVAVGIVLILLPTGKKSGVGEPPKPSEGEMVYDTAEMERRICRLLGKASGVGRIEVMLTLKSDMEYVYADEYDTSVSRRGSDGEVDSSKSERVNYKTIRDGSGGESPILLKRLYPEYKGAVVICDGADNAAVKLRILSAISSLTGLRSDAITIIKMN